MASLRTIHVVLLLLACAGSLGVYGHGGGGDDEEAPTGVNLRSKKLIVTKVLCLVILLVSTFAGGVSPYFFRWNESFLLLGTQFAGGVFLGTALMHFLPDANETIADLTTKTYPFVYMLAAAGYLLTMLGDSVIIYVIERNKSEAKVEPREDELRGDTILLILALCFHSVFEGIAIGIADTTGDAWRNLWTISLHKIFAAVAMGIALLRMLPKRPLVITMVYSLAFAVSSPIGVGIGIAIDATTQGRVADWIFCISMGLACGVFLYVAINHLISKGFKPQRPSSVDTPFFKLLAVLAGVGVIAIVMIWD
ncbi:unnamed protein product [Spirodela intermedia]|uniref:Uncharacterized protein n=1 Tax=Spirodela intermedia TaxID=51605 RepID=A0A7I8JHK1_SPIIN|nr:unnamed protein product [Spirodela intermedia]CAA6669391.1 unnamed protein product [Spirodela intermedia]